MTEKCFWEFLGGLLGQGRINQVSSVIDSNEPQLQQAGRFIGGHILLPENYDKIAKDKIIEISELLLNRNIAISTKEAIIIILAHYPSREALNTLQKYNQRPDEGLRFFSRFALDECRMWNE
jgi:hypothetical protein